MENRNKKLERYYGALQFIKFNLVGVLNTVVDFVAYSILCMMGVDYMLAQVISYSLGIANSYLLNSLWTFGKERRHTVDEFGKFLLVNLCSLGVSLGVLWICRNPLGIENNLLCKLIATPLSLAVNFAGNKLFVFKGQMGAEKKH